MFSARLHFLKSIAVNCAFEMFTLLFITSFQKHSRTNNCISPPEKDIPYSYLGKKVSSICMEFSFFFFLFENI